MSDDLYDILKEFEEKEKQEAARAKERKEQLLQEHGESAAVSSQAPKDNTQKSEQPAPPPKGDAGKEEPAVSTHPPVDKRPDETKTPPKQQDAAPPQEPSSFSQQSTASNQTTPPPYAAGTAQGQPGQPHPQPPYPNRPMQPPYPPHGQQGQGTYPTQFGQPPYPPHHGGQVPPQQQRSMYQNQNPYYRQYPQYPYGQGRPPYPNQPMQPPYPPHGQQGQGTYPTQPGQQPYPPHNGGQVPPQQPPQPQTPSKPPMPLPEEKKEENSAGSGDGTPPKKKKNMAFRILAAVVGVVFLGSVIGFSILGGYNLASHNQDDGNAVVGGGESSSSSSSAPIDSPSMEIQDIPDSDGSAPQEEGALSPKEVYSQVSPSVVAITSYGADFMSGDSYGSGIIMNEEGYILTNAHVLSNANNVMQVKLLSGEEYEATFIAADSKTDLGIIKIDTPNLTPATFGDSDQLSVGDTVYAIGNPGGPELESSFSSGMVSGINRKVVIEGNSEMSYIQTDAAINPGNSGGALINAFGQVVGINTAKLSSTSSGTAYEGLGFAIPITQAQPYIDELIQNGKVSRVKLGASFQVVDETMAALYNLPEGLYVYEIEEDSNLLQAGVQAGDVITQADGQALTSVDQLKEIVRQKQVGDTVHLTVSRQRRGSTQTQQFEVDVQVVEDVDSAFSTNNSQTSPLQ